MGILIFSIRRISCTFPITELTLSPAFNIESSMYLSCDIWIDCEQEILLSELFPGPHWLEVEHSWGFRAVELWYCAKCCVASYKSSKSITEVHFENYWIQKKFKKLFVYPTQTHTHTCGPGHTGVRNIIHHYSGHENILFRNNNFKF